MDKQRRLIMGTPLVPPYTLLIFQEIENNQIRHTPGSHGLLLSTFPPLSCIIKAALS